MFNNINARRLFLPSITAAGIMLFSLLLPTAVNADTLIVKHGEVFIVNAPERCEQSYLRPLRRTIGKEFTIEQTCHAGRCDPNLAEQNSFAETRQNVYLVNFSGDIVHVTDIDDQYVMIVNYEVVAEDSRPIHANANLPGKLFELIEQEREKLEFPVQVDCIRSVKVKVLHGIFLFKKDVCPNSEPIFHPNQAGITLMRLRTPSGGPNQYLSVKTLQKPGLAQSVTTTSFVDENNRLDKPVNIYWSCRDPGETKQKLTERLLDAINDGMDHVHELTQP